MGWRAKADSSVGVSHQKYGIPCQDSAYYDFVGDIMIGAVADGAGSAKRAEKGAQIAVEIATEYLRDWVRSQSKQLATVRSRSQENAKQLFEQKFTNVLETVLAALQEEAAQSQCQLSDYACTLLLFIAAPDWLAAMQLGDGFIVIKPRHSEYQLLFQPDKGEFANETTFVTSNNARNTMKIRVIWRDQEFVCASTDGLERVAIHLDDWKPSSKFFDPFRKYIGEQEHLEKEPNYLKIFLDSPRLNERTDDDKTLLLCFYDPKIPLSSPRQREKRIERDHPVSENPQANIIQSLVPASKHRRVDFRSLLIQNFISSLLTGILTPWLTPASWGRTGVFSTFSGAFLVFILATLLAWSWLFSARLLKWLTVSLYAILPGFFLLIIIKFYSPIMGLPKITVIAKALVLLYLPIAMAVMISILISITASMLPTTPRRTFTQNFRLIISFSFLGFLLGLFLFLLIRGLGILA